jgi:hypothetical protein
MGRSLLAMSDRTGGETFPLTQEFLSRLLGVTRPTVSLTAADLQRAGMIRYHRGVMRILDPIELAGASCECYGVMRDEYTRLMPVFAPPRTPALRRSQ